MALTELPYQPFRLSRSSLYLLDQRALPHKKIWIKCQNARQVSDAIRQMVVRGAPLIGTVAVCGLYLEALQLKREGRLTIKNIQRAAQMLKRARPTAVNLSWAIDQALMALPDSKNFASSLFEEAKRQEKLNIEWTRSISVNGAQLIKNKEKILTICNTGPLATGGYGTALGSIIWAFKEGKKNIEVFVSETRPYLQGSRLTAWELKNWGIPFFLITDNAAAWAIENEKISLILTGADRIASNGDTANKIGTLNLAILAKHYHVPFYIVAPLSSFDHNLPSGNSIPIERRTEEEVLYFAGGRVAPRGVRALNPAFDITPQELITGFVTEKGFILPPFKENILKVLS